MSRLSREQRLRAIGMLEAGLGERTVACRLGRSQPAISNLARQCNQTHSLNDRPRTGRPRVTTPAQDQQIILQHFRDAVLNVAVSYALLRLCDCTWSRLIMSVGSALQVHSVLSVHRHLRALTPRYFSALGVWTLPASVLRCLSVPEPRLLCASTPLMLNRSLHRCPQCLSAPEPWCLGASAPQCPWTLMHRCSRSVDAPCIAMSKFHSCTSCGGMLPPQDKHFLCVKCLEMQHASSTLASQPWTLRKRLAEFTGAASSVSSAEPSAALGAPPSPSSTCLPACHSVYPVYRIQRINLAASPLRSSKRARHKRQAKDMAQVLKYYGQAAGYSPCS
ncbi:UNVERIFIED_CONTAM: hypothetical protein FKN15_024414 [Acipenser sinensis]